MQDLKLWLIRHGQSRANLGAWESKPENTPLTSLGREQASMAADSISECPDLIIRSPLKRARDSAQYLITRWPDVPVVTWPIQELVYLSPQKMALYSPEERKERIHAYWDRPDPAWRDGEDAESFEHFLQRVATFHQQVQQLQGFVTVVGHGLFFNAYVLGLQQGFVASAAWMTLFREHEVAQPMRNSEIYRLELKNKTARDKL